MNKQLKFKGMFTPIYFFQKKREATFFLCFKSAFVPYNEWYERAFKAQEESSFSLFFEKISWRERTLILYIFIYRQYSRCTRVLLRALFGATEQHPRHKSLPKRSFSMLKTNLLWLLEF